MRSKLAAELGAIAPSTWLNCSLMLEHCFCQFTHSLMSANAHNWGKLTCGLGTAYCVVNTPVKSGHMTAARHNVLSHILILSWGGCRHDISFT